MTRLLMISYDAVGDLCFERLLQYPNFAALAKQAAQVRSVDSVFLTNTYPVHASVVTGVEQKTHRLINNTLPFPRKDPPWQADAENIKAKTLWQAAAEKGMRTAAVLWPVTARAKEIRYDIPEVLPRPGHSQLAASLAAGSKRLQARMFLRHRHLLNGIGQPARDNFAAACMADILREKQPELALMHFTCYDTLCHQYGTRSPMLAAAFDALDRNLGLLLDAVGSDASVLLFSDHAQLDVHTVVAPNEWLAAAGLLENSGGQWKAGPAGCFIECSGGSAFFHPGNLGVEAVAQCRNVVAAGQGFHRFLRPDEMQACGRGTLPFGFCARPGYCYEAYPTAEKANHGYPVDYANYKVFYLAKGGGFAPGAAPSGGSLLDLAPLAANALGVELPGIRPVRQDVLA